MKSIHPIIWIGLTLLGVWGIKKFIEQASKKISFGAPSIIGSAINWISSSITLSIPVISDTGVNAPIQGFTGALYYGDDKLADLRLRSPVTIPASGKTDIVVESINKNTDLLQRIVTIMGSGSALRSISIKGDLRAINLDWPIDETIDLLPI